MIKCYIPEYPRPQFVRGAWQKLNGAWDFAFDDQAVGEREKWFEHFPSGKVIQVPFSYETPMSGIGDEAHHQVVWYRRVITAKANDNQAAILHFEGSDYHTKVWVNGRLAGEHTGGYTRFSFDITYLLCEGNNIITVQVQDSCDIMQPRGKQRWKNSNFGCWYVQTTGIWKTVWLEYRAVEHLEKVKMTPLLQEEMLELEWQVTAEDYNASLELEAEISFNGTVVSGVRIPVMERRGSVRLPVSSHAVHEWGIRKWSPKDPALYDIFFTLRRNGSVLDEVGSYFGMRDIRIDKGTILLNNVPLYQRLILDQGYWKNSHLTPPDEEALVKDIDCVLEMGYNGVRKHQKIEDGRFAFWCDVKGLLLWCEMPSAYAFGDDAVRAFSQQWLDVVDQHYNHPSVITWTPFNESWGVAQIKTDRSQQQFTEAIYYLTKSIDNMRPVIVNDGWEHTVSDILTLHDYEEGGQAFFNRYREHKDAILNGSYYHNQDRAALADGYAYKGQPVLISEYGGAAFSGGARGTWGYGNTVETKEQFLKRIEDMTDAIKKLPWVCGYCYTQVSDVQQEINGLLDMERNYKADPKELYRINTEGIPGC